MRRLIEKFSWLQLLLGLILVALGVLTMVIAINVKENYELTIFIVWASVLFVLATALVVFDIVAYHDKAEFSSLIAAGLCIGVGIFVLVNRDFISEVITTLVPYILMAMGGVLLLKTIILAVRRVNFKSWLTPFVVAVIFLAAGIVFICVKELKQVIYISLGIMFIVLGAVEIIGYITFLANRRAPRENAVAPAKKKKKHKQESVDATPVYDGEPEVVDAEPKLIEEEDDVKLIE